MSPRGCAAGGPAAASPRHSARRSGTRAGGRKLSRGSRRDSATVVRTGCGCVGRDRSRSALRRGRDRAPCASPAGRARAPRLAEIGEILVAELAAAREAVGHLAPRASDGPASRRNRTGRPDRSSRPSRASSRCRSASGKPPCATSSPSGKKSARGACAKSRTASLPARSIHSCARLAFRKSAKSDGRHARGEPRRRRRTAPRRGCRR